MNWFGLARISDPDSWEGRMARDHAAPHTLAKWQHQRWIEAGIISQPSDAWGTPTWYPPAPWIQEPEPERLPEPGYIDGVDISRYVESFGITAEEVTDSLRHTIEENRHMIEAAERAVSDVRGAIVGVRLYRIEDDLEVLRVSPLPEDDDLSSRPLTEEDFQRWEDAINYEPTHQSLDVSSEPQSDETSDLLERISSGVKEWGKEKDRGDT